VSIVRWNSKGMRRSTGRNRGGYPKDELVGQRRDSVEPAVERRRRYSFTRRTKCLRTARYGRTMRDLRRTGRVSGWHWSKQTYKRKRSGEQRRSVVGLPHGI